MILAKMKSGALGWHVVTRHDGDFRLVCDTARVVIPKVMAEYSPNLLLCGNCREALNKLDLAWRMQIAKDSPKHLTKSSFAKPRVNFDQVVQSLIKSRRSS
jgi:hypothetical protein